MARKVHPRRTRFGGDVRFCSKCKKTFPATAEFFNRCKDMPDGFASSCKTCKAEVNKQWYDENGGKLICRNKHLRNKYKVSEDVLKDILSRAQGVCDICGKHETSHFRGERKPLSVDHDHVTGKVRGMLCWRCNVNLGHYEMADFAIKARIYLDKNGE